MKMMFESFDIRGGIQVTLGSSEKKYLVVSTNFSDSNGVVFRLMNPTYGVVNCDKNGWMERSEFADFLNRNSYTLSS